MHIGFIFAMEEEAVALKKIFSKNGELIENNNYKILRYNQNNIDFTIIISGIGKSFAASATTILIEKYNVDYIINIGSAGGINCAVGDIIISNQAMFHDVDVSVFGYEKGQIPKQPLIFKSKEQVVRIDNLINQNLKEYNISIGCIATGDQFINDINLVNSIKKSNNEVKALDMEAASIAQISYNYNKGFLFIKKISDLADSSAPTSFEKEIANFEERIGEVIKSLLKI